MSGQPQRYAVLADDLTGALDCAAAFLSSGHTVFVSLGPEAPEGAAALVVSLNLDTRRADVETTKRVVESAFRSLSRAGLMPLYVKIDSTLRGHSGVEVSHTAQLSGASLIVLTPAFPANGRTVEQGKLFVSGVPLADTEVGRDPLSPAGTSSVADILSRYCKMPVRAVRLDQVRSDVLAVLFAQMSENGPVVAVCDAVEDSDLSRIASAAIGVAGSLEKTGGGRSRGEPRTANRVLFAGSAGLAGALASLIHPSQSHGITSQFKFAALTGPVLVVTASQRSLADRQIAGLANTHSLATVPVEFALSGDSVTGEPRFDKTTATRLLAEGRHTALRATVAGDLTSLDPAAVRDIADHVTATLGKLVNDLTPRQKPSALVIIGGDTAFGTLTALSARGIVLHSEPLPGVPVGAISGGVLDGTVIATKAGAFGDETTLVRLFDYLVNGRAAQ